MKYGGLTLGQIEAIVNKLGGMEGVQKFLSGALMVTRLHIIDCDAKPFIPHGWCIEEHKKGGQLIFDSSKILLHRSLDQQSRGSIGGNKLREELENKPTLNASVLDYLLAHPELIPEEWTKCKYGDEHRIFFFGTIYRNSEEDGRVYVRCLSFTRRAIRWDYEVLPNALYTTDYSALHVEDFVRQDMSSNK